MYHSKMTGTTNKFMHSCRTRMTRHVWREALFNNPIREDDQSSRRQMGKRRRLLTLDKSVIPCRPLRRFHEVIQIYVEIAQTPIMNLMTIWILDGKLKLVLVLVLLLFHCSQEQISSTDYQKGPLVHLDKPKPTCVKINGGMVICNLVDSAEHVHKALTPIDSKCRV